MTAFDANANLALATVTVAPAPPVSGTSLTVDDASSFPVAPFYALAWPPDVCATLANAEIVRVTLAVGNVFTITRAQGGTSAQAIAAGWQFANVLTAEVIDQIEAAINVIEATAVFDGDAAGGDLTGTYPNPTLAAIGAATGPIGNATTVPVVTIDAKGRVTALTSTAITGVPPGGAAGGVLSGTYPNPGLAASVAGAALGLTANVLNVLVDGTTIQVNGSDQLEVITSGVLTDAVIIDPATSLRNVILPTVDAVPLTLHGVVAGSEMLFQAGVNGQDPGFRLSPVNSAVGIGAGTFNPAAYGLTPTFYSTGFVLSHADDGYVASNGGPPYTPGVHQRALAFINDALVIPTVDGQLAAVDHYGSATSFRYGGSKTGRWFRATYSEAILKGTKAAGSGAQLEWLNGGNFNAFVDDGAVPDVDLITGLSSYAYSYGNGGTIGNISAVEAIGYVSYPSVGSAPPVTGKIIGVNAQAGVEGSTGTAVPEVNAVRASLYPPLFGSGRDMTLAKGLHVANMATADVVTSYGIYLEQQTGASSESWSIRSLGGKSQLDAGAATVIPLTIHAAGSQSANLFVTEDSSGNDLVAIDPAGKILFGTSADTNLYRSAADTLKTDDTFLVGANYTIDPSGFWDGPEISAPATPAANHGRLFWRDSGGGKTQLVAKFESGNTVVIAEDF